MNLLCCELGSGRLFVCRWIHYCCLKSMPTANIIFDQSIDFALLRRLLYVAPDLSMVTTSRKVTHIAIV
jgi:hypothetical protein